MSKNGDENVALVVFLTFLPFAIGVFAACLLQFGCRKKKDPQPPVENSISDKDDLEAGEVSKKVMPETSNGAEVMSSHTPPFNGSCSLFLGIEFRQRLALSLGIASNHGCQSVVHCAVRNCFA